jgi:uncharacterized membrane protein YfcA
VTLFLFLILFLAAFAGGALNAVAGGGSFIGLPALILAGVPAVAANATNALALWPASIASAWAYRREVSATRATIVSLGGVSLAGGLGGGLLLLRTSDDSFLRLLPWLLLTAAATFSFGGAIQRLLAQHPAGAAEHPGGAATWHHLAVMLLQFAIAVYGGYFGGGMGFMMLATLTVAGMSDIHRMNAVKSVLAVIINGVAVAEFIALGAIVWAPGAVMVAGGIAGGYLGAATARRTDQRYMRGLVTVIAWGLTLYFFFLR